MINKRWFLVLLSIQRLCAVDVLTQLQAYQFVAEKLASSTVPLAYVQKVFFDQRTAIDQVTLTKIGGRSRGLGWYTDQTFYQQRVIRGKLFYEKNRNLVQAIEQKYGVSKAILLSIVGIETNYGAFVGKHDVFNVWYTQLVACPSRQAWAIKEIVALLHYCYVRAIDPHSLKGSYAGAFGYGQFLPSSFNAYGVTLSGQGLARHDAWPDTLASVAHYLVVHGCASTSESARKALYAYNHSSVYIEAILQLGVLLDKALV